jgi:hypothetical protein
MRALMIIAVPILALVAFFAFCMAAVNPESEVVTHTMTQEQFAKVRVISIVVCALAVLGDLVLIWRLFMRRSAREESHVA